MADKIQVVEEIQKLAAGYPNQAVTQATFLQYAGVLSQFPIDIIKDACGRASRQNKFFPSLPEMFDLCDRTESSARGKAAAENGTFKTGYKIMQEMALTFGYNMKDAAPEQDEEVRMMYRAIAVPWAREVDPERIVDRGKYEGHLAIIDAAIKTKGITERSQRR